jgi:hypothetical protein
MMILSTSSFQVSAFTVSLRYLPFRQPSTLHMGTPGMDMSGNTWKPDSEKMGSTDTGDYFPEGYNPDEEIAFSR